MDILKIVHKAEHPDERENGTICACSAKRLIRATDIYLDGTGGMREVDLARNWKRAFEKVLTGREKREFFWDM